ncbi:MAG: OmpW/AlkL family protein [Bacteriovoracia bacterium]
MKTKLSALLVTTVLLSSTAALADNMMVRMRAINVMPDESGTPSAIGGDVKLNTATVPELDFSYFFSKNLAVELILATTTHNASAQKTSLNNLDLGHVSLLPPTLLAQYHLEFGKLKPYVGAGLNYTIFYGEEPGVARSVTYENNFGYALQVGGDYQIGDNLFLNLDIKKIYLSTDVEVKTYANGTVKADVDIDPLIVGMGLGWKF